MDPRVIQAANPSPMTLDGTRTYIVGRRRSVVIDPGPHDGLHVERIAAELAGAESVEIVVTHRHADHAGAARALAERVRARIRGGRHPARDVLDSIEVAAEGHVFETDDGILTVLPTPGHTPDHIALVWEGASGGRAVFVGDLLLGEGDTALVAAPEGNVADYLRSLDRLEAIQAEKLFPTHGPPLPDPPAAIRRFRDHRLRRVEQVRAILFDAPRTTTPEIVSRLYGDDLAPAIRAAANGSIEAVRIHLQSSSVDSPHRPRESGNPAVP